jgi:hypothetical protein
MVRSSSSKTSNMRLYVIIGILAFAIIVGTIIGSSYNNRELFTNHKKLIYLYMDNCPHCVSFTKEWVKIETAVTENPSKYDFTLQKHNLTSEEGKKYATDNKIDYAPAILFVSSSKTTEFNGNSRTSADVLTWASKQE